MHNKDVKLQLRVNLEVYEGKFFMILVIKRRNILASTLFCFHQIFKQGQNIKIDIWKCSLKVELVKKSSHRGGTSL